MIDNNQHSLGDILKKVIKKNHLEYGIRKVEAKEIWEKTMGVSIQKYTTEVTLKGDVLYVGISSAGLRQELSYGTEKIIRILNEEFGEEIVKKLILR